MAKKPELSTDELLALVLEQSFDDKFKIFCTLKDDLIEEATQLKTTGEKATNVLKEVVKN